MAADVKPGDRKNHSATGDGRFPINSSSEAKSALELRGHATDKSQRRSIIRRAAKYLPAAAKAAWTEDKAKGLI
jgi:hypothetical protein